MLSSNFAPVVDHLERYVVCSSSNSSSSLSSIVTFGSSLSPDQPQCHQQKEDEIPIKQQKPGKEISEVENISRQKNASSKFIVWVRMSRKSGSNVPLELRANSQQSSLPFPWNFQPFSNLPEDKALDNTPLHLLRLLSVFHFYRCHYELQKSKCQGNVYVPSLVELFRKCRRYTVAELCDLSHTELWRKVHPVYGAKIRNFMCEWTDRPVPVILSRNKIKDSQEVQGHRFLAHTHIPKKVKLFEFFLDLLDEPYYRYAISWKDQGQLLFKIEDKNKLTKLWTKVKDNMKPSKDNFGHTLRYCEKEGFLVKVDAKRNAYTVFQFTQQSLRQYHETRRSTTPPLSPVAATSNSFFGLTIDSNNRPPSSSSHSKAVLL